MEGCWVKGRVERNDIRLGNERIQTNILNAGLLRPRLIPYGIVSNYPRAETVMENLRNATADITAANNTNRSVTEFKSNELATVKPSVRFGRTRATPELANQIDHFADGTFGHGLPLNRLLNLRDEASALPCGVNVNVVESETVASNKLHLRLALKELPVELGRSRGDDNIRIANRFSKLPATTIARYAYPLHGSKLLEPLHMIRDGIAKRIRIGDSYTHTTHVLPHDSTFQMRSARAIPTCRRKRRRTPRPSSYQPSSRRCTKRQRERRE